jgi:hypothetical protein
MPTKKHIYFTIPVDKVLDLKQNIYNLKNMADDHKKTPKLTEEKETPKKEKETDTEVVTVKTESDSVKTDTPDKKTSSEDDLTVEEEDKSEKKEAEVPDLAQKKVTSFGLIDTDKAKEDLGVEEKEDTPIISETKESMEEKPTTEEKKENISQNEVNKWIENYDEVNKPTEKGEKKGFKIVLIILLVLSFLAILAGGFVYYQKNISKRVGMATETPTPQVTAPTQAPTETPSPSAEVKLSDYNIQILNGSGIPGEAGSAKDLLSSLDFNKIDTGNADNYDYTDTEVSLKEDISNQVYNEIKDKLDSTYTVVKSDSSVLSTSSYDVIIIVGTKK